MKKTVFICLFTLASILMFSQSKNVIEIKSVTGVGYDQNLDMARQKALNNAKTNALSKAGIAENVNSHTDLFKSETENNYQELFTSQIFTEIQGAVRGVELVNEHKSFTEGDNIKVEIEISCEVIRYESSTDLKFVAEINNLNAFYYEGDLLRFDILPSENMWVNIFCIPQNESDSYFLFPNALENAFMLKKGEKYEFPLTVDFELSLDDDVDQQTDRLIFVCTKEEYPFVGDITYKSIIDWIFSLEPNQRFVRSYSYSVVKK